MSEKPTLRSRSDDGPSTSAPDCLISSSRGGYYRSQVSSPSGFSTNTKVVPGDRVPSAQPPPFPGKVAIPRAARVVHSSQVTYSGRASRACANCRIHRVKCSGGNPACQRCLDVGILCTYADRKGERLSKQLSNLTSQVEVLEKLLTDLYPGLDSLSAQRVDQALRRLNNRNLHTDSELSAHNTHPSLSDSIPRSALPARCIQSLAMGSSTAEPNNNHVVIDEGPMEQPFIGEHSEMTWLAKLIDALDSDAISQTKVSRGATIRSLSYLQVASEVSLCDDVDLSQWPPQHIADKLVNCYFGVVDNIFPILDKPTFLTEYRSFYSTCNFQAENRWKSLLNLVFAIAIRHVNVIGKRTPDYEQHHVFFSRAWRLSGSDCVLPGHMDLQQVQIEGLTILYLLSVGQVERAWKYLGMAIRSSVAIGLNSKADAEGNLHALKGHQNRLWWAIFILDTALCSMTGRPPGISAVFCTTPLPLPHGGEDVWDRRVMPLVTDQEMCNSLLSTLFSNSPTVALKEMLLGNVFARSASDNGKQRDEGPQAPTELSTANVSLIFLYAIDLSLLVRRAVDTLYSPGGMKRPWMEIETAISSLDQVANDWLCRLPAELDFTKPNATPLFAQERTALAFRFHAAKVIILQPSLRRLAYWPSGKAHLGALSNQLAATCVQAARHLVNLLSDKLHPGYLDDSGLWCFTLHHIMQATVVLLTELFTRTLPGTGVAATLADELQKPLSWLKQRSITDSASRQAWHICVDIISRYGSAYGLTVDA